MISRNKMLLLLLLVLPFLANGQTCKFCAAGDVTVDITTGAYKDILVVVDKDVSYDTQIIQNIKDYFQSASDALFNATKHVSGRYFGEVTILLPLHWPEENITDATTESSDKATFSIEPDNAEWGSNPHTIRVVGDCGSPGKVTILPEGFINDRREAEKYGSNIGKTIVHEWAHLRYGLFDESAWEEGGDQVSCDSIEDVAVIPRCSTAVEGDLTEEQGTGSCIFIPHDKQTNGVSLLYAPYLESAFTFCDDTSGDIGPMHNPYAINNHNSRCDLRSGWSVLRDHKDFKSQIVGANATSPVKFRIVKENTLRISIVMDVSGSMQGSRMQWMQQSVENFLYSLLHASQMNEETVMVGMTQFSTIGTILHPLVTLNDTTVNSLVAAIPQIANGGTSIGAGIRTGLEVLKQKAKRSLLLVFTDGEENAAPYIVDVKDEVCNYNATAYGIIVSNVASNHPLVTLGQETCGGSCVYDDTSSTTIYDCLWDAMKSRVPQIAPIEISADVVTIKKTSSWTDLVSVDSLFTTNVIFRFEWSQTPGCDQITVDLITPDGVLINQHNSTNYTMSASQTSIEIRAASQTVGDWSYTIKNPSSVSCGVRYTVEGYTSGVGEAPLISVDMSKSNLVLSTSNSLQANSLAVYVKVTKGTTPVTGATVKAIVTRITASGVTKSWTLDLADNGAGADIRKNDGIYSRYFTAIESNGAYTVRAEVVGEEGKVSLLKETRSYGSGAPPLPAFRVAKTTKTEPTEAFQRSSVGGSVQISGYSAATNPESLYPPEKIRDLQTSILSEENRTLRIQWTAVGAYLDQGNASSYDVRISSNASLLQTAFSEAYPVSNDILLNGSLTSPKAAGDSERLDIFLSNTNFTTLQQQYYVAVVAINANNKMGQVSNVASFSFNSLTQSTTTKKTSSGGSCFQRWTIAAIVIGSILVYETVI